MLANDKWSDKHSSVQLACWDILKTCHSCGRRLTCTQNAATDQEHRVVATELRDGRHPATRKKSKAQKTVSEGMDVAFKVSRSHFD